MFANGIAISADPLKLTPAILLAVCNSVAVAAFPDVFCVPAIFTHGRFIFAVPLKLTPPIVLAVCNAVAVPAFQVILPIIALLKVLFPPIV